MDEAPQPKHPKIDWFDPLIVMAFVCAFIGDLLSIIIIPHYILGIAVIAILWPKSHGFITKIVLLIGFLLPVPGTLLATVCATILLTNSKIVRAFTEQVAMVAVTVATGGAGAALEAGALAGEGAAVVAEGAATAAEVAAGATEAAAGAAEVAGGAAEVAGTAAETAGAATEAAGGAAEGAGEATEGVGKAAESEAKETLKDKVVRKLKEKAKEKLEDMVKQGLSSDDDEPEEPTEEEIVDEMARQQQLDEALGMQPDVMTENERELLPDVVPISRGRGWKGESAETSSHSQKVTATDKRASVVQMPPSPNGNGKNTSDVVLKDTEKLEEWEKNRAA